ncbi:type II toxin-antitoxin system VapC family toxin [Bifidobacterium simiarum]|uniref:type II toxin-antitoxin system VapC family toxin n=1 Tax=Bifidobacterium simiarum TaxID=2045441 RepID=UPI001BDC0899|nr:type II toxin-antitoxin system VapC family toxin [Bifidobacterium simiarum]MBT1166433.1 type II toxin-antitoxin system VapC family toxin [Bifidobacterium simiarum]
MTIVLDTNVISELVRPRPDRSVMQWFAGRSVEDFAITAITVAELFYGCWRMPAGRRQHELSMVLNRMLSPFVERVLPFDATSALRYARIKVERQRMGRPIMTADAQIAATALANDCTLATRNIKDFEGTGVTLINPWNWN